MPTELMFLQQQLLTTTAKCYKAVLTLTQQAEGIFTPCRVRYSKISSSLLFWIIAVILYFTHGVTAMHSQWLCHGPAMVCPDWSEL